MNEPGKLNYEPHCPKCDEILDGYSGIDGSENPPVPEDFTICMHCGSILQFTNDNTLALKTMDDVPDDLKALIKAGLGAYQNLKSETDDFGQH